MARAVQYAVSQGVYAQWGLIPSEAPTHIAPGAGPWTKLRLRDRGAFYASLAHAVARDAPLPRSPLIRQLAVDTCSLVFDLDASAATPEEARAVRLGACDAVAAVLPSVPFIVCARPAEPTADGTFKCGLHFHGMVRTNRPSLGAFAAQLNERAPGGKFDLVSSIYLPYFTHKSVGCTYRPVALFQGPNRTKLDHPSACVETCRTLFHVDPLVVFASLMCDPLKAMTFVGMAMDAPRVAPSHRSSDRGRFPPGWLYAPPANHGVWAPFYPPAHRACERGQGGKFCFPASRAAGPVPCVHGGHASDNAFWIYTPDTETLVLRCSVCNRAGRAVTLAWVTR